MRHDWIVDVLTDLHAYATRNDLPGIAAKVQAALEQARLELCMPEDDSLHGLLRLVPRGRPN